MVLPAALLLWIPGLPLPQQEVVGQVDAQDNDDDAQQLPGGRHRFELPEEDIGPHRARPANCKRLTAVTGNDGPL